MSHILYKLILKMHPRAFRCRFSDEMLSIFEEKSEHQFPLALLLDCLRSLVRQWMRQTNCWKLPIPICGAFLQVLWFVYPRKGHQNWPENQQSLTPYLREFTVVTLATLCALFFLILSLAAWTLRVQRRRLEGQVCK